MSLWISGSGELDKPALLRLLAYTLRAAYRCTPFGLFASVATTTFASDRELLNFDPNTRFTDTHLDMKVLLKWLNEQLLSETHLPLFPLSLNKYAVSYSTFTLTQALTLNETDDDGTRFIVRSKKGLRDLLSSMKNSISFRDLEAKFESQGFSYSAFVKMLSNLIKAWVIVPNIWPSLSTNSLSETRQLFSTDRETSDSLRQVQVALDTFDQVPFSDKSEKVYQRVVKQIQTVFESANNPIHVDAYHSFNGALPIQFKKEIALFSRFIFQTIRTVDQSSLIAAIRSYYEGHERLIPLLDLIGPMRKIDPAHYSTVWKSPNADDFSERPIIDRTLEAIMSRQNQVELCEDDVNKYLSRSVTLIGPTSVEFGVHILANTAQEINRGVFGVVISNFPPVAGSLRSGSRFYQLNLLMNNSAQEDVLAHTSHVDVGFSFLPAISRASNVARNYTSYPRVLALGATAHSTDDKALDLDRVFVGIDQEKIFLYSTELDRRLNISAHSMTDIHALLPSSAKFLSGIIEPHRFALPLALKEFESFIYLPRISYGRAILRRSRLLIRREELITHADSDTWLKRSLARWSFPETVLATTNNMSSLPLNLAMKWCFDLLIDQSRRSRAQYISLEEVLPALDNSWFHGNERTFNLEILSTAVFTQP